MGDWNFGDPFEETPGQEPAESGGSASGGMNEDAGEAPPPPSPTAPPGGTSRSVLPPIGAYARPPQSPPGEAGATPPPPFDHEDETVEPFSSEGGWQAEPTPLPAEPADWRDTAVMGEPVEPSWRDEEPETVTAEPPRRSRNVPPARGSNRKSWGFAAAGLAVGIVLGAGLLIWQRAAMLADQRTLENRLKTIEASATASAEEVATLTDRLQKAETSITALASQNGSLTAQLESATAALSTANSKLAEAAKTLTITERSVSPGSVAAGKQLVLQVKLQGAADKVEMKIVGLPPLDSSKTYTLTKVGTTSGIQTWQRTVAAPSATGMYRYYATAYIGTKEFSMPGVSAWTFEVTP